MDKTIVVAVERRKKHPLYHKVMSVTERYKAHDEDNTCKLGDVVRIGECRPMSKDKRWRVLEIVTRGDVADVAPEIYRPRNRANGAGRRQSRRSRQ